MIQKGLILLFFAIAMLACDQDNDAGMDFKYDSPLVPSDQVADVCIVERQCFTDPFSDLDAPPDDASRVQALIGYLQGEGIPVYDAYLEVRYFEAVCEACHVCPSGDRFRIRTDSDAIPDLLARDLWLMDCGDEVSYRRGFYQETKCSDPWAQAWQEPGYQTPMEKKKTIASFLIEQGIRVFEIQLNPGEGQSCEACHCLTGNRFEILVDERDMDTATQLGFAFI